MFPRHKLLDLLPITLVVVMSFTSLCLAAEKADRVIYVDAGFEGENPTGESWHSAYASLQQAIDEARKTGGAEIWVKAGIYTPAPDNRKSSIKLHPGIELLGGFRGSETGKNQRNPTTNRTIISGDIGTIGLDSDNSYHVLTACSDAIVSGFIIIRGNADGMDSEGTGGGILAPQGTLNFTISDCTFEKNVAGWQGGAIYADQANVTITNCTFFSNGAASGGAIATRGPSTLGIHHSHFSLNHARNSGGAILLAPQTKAVLSTSAFIRNSSLSTAGVLSAHSKSGDDRGVEIRNCVFSGNRANEGAAALLFEGRMSPAIIDSTFEGNICHGGAGAIANRQGVTAVVTGCTFNKNQGAPNTENIINDETSSTVDDQVMLADIQPPDEVKDTIKRKVPDSFVFDGENNKVNLLDIVGVNPFTVLVLGELTDPDFIENYREIEAIARDYRPKQVDFFYLYRFLSHPENNGFLQPFNKIERARQVQLIRDLLKTETDWLYDLMDNQTVMQLAPNGGKSVFIFSKSGEELYSGTMLQTSSLRSALKNLAGETDSETSASRFPKTSISAVNPMESKLFERIHFNPEKEAYLPLAITPVDSQTPFYAKLRVEASEELLRTGNGRLYLGFHLDPLYKMRWNNEEDPLRYEVRATKGLIAPSSKSATAILSVATDNDPREFLLRGHQLDTAAPLMLRVKYTVYSPTLRKSFTVQQQYLINLKADPCGGKAYRRQVAYKDHHARNTDHASTKIPIQLRQYDTNGDGKLSRNEVTGNLWTRFPEIDSNRDGYLNDEEYGDYLRSR